jgi:hypothetical protein
VTNDVVVWIGLVYCVWLLVGIYAMASTGPYEKPCRAVVFAILSFVPIYILCRGIAIAWKWLFEKR